MPTEAPVVPEVALDVLGRGVIVDDGSAPGPWASAPRIVVDQAALVDPGGLVKRLHQAWAQREPVVIELRVDPVAFRRPETIRAAPWTLDPGLPLWNDRLHHLVWSNNYDARSGELIWWWARKGQRLGGSADFGPGAAPADLVLGDGTSAWIDGGPPDDVDPARLAPAALVRSESVESGHLRPVPIWSAPTADLAPDQLAAVGARGGPARIIAPAGSGKTRVLTERLQHLLADRGHDRSAVLAVAYNRKAQEEMASRTAGLGARIQTLNALGYELIGRHRGGRPPLIDEREVRRRLEPLLPRLQHRLNTDPMAPYLEGLSAIRLGLRDPDDVEITADAPGLAAALDPYRAGLHRDGVIDFDEQIVHAVELLLTDGEFRRREQARHRHLLVDEFQDLTPAHVLLIRLLSAPGFDVFGVGDDDQVIYGHAGASPRFLVDFASLFPGATAHALETNYRCPPAVVRAAATLLGYNDRRVPKTIRAARQDGAADQGAAGSSEERARADGALSIITTPPDLTARRLVELVQHDLSSGASPDDVAVLTRTNSLLLAPQIALVAAGIPVRSSLRADVLERLGLRAALAWVRVALDPDSIAPSDLAEIRRRPSRALPSWIDKWLARCRSRGDVVQAARRMEDDKIAVKLEALVTDIDELHRLVRDGATTRQLLRAVRDDVGLGGAMELLDGRPGAEGSSHLDDLDALIQVADLQPDAAGFEQWLRRSLRATATPTSGANGGGDDDQAPAVTLSTVHRVKGREWPSVIVFGANAGLFPHRLADDIEEERRVFHVAITRGIEHVTVMADDDRPSPFIPELDGTAVRGAAAASAGARGGSAGRGSAVRNPLTSGRPSAAATPALDGEDAVVFAQLREWRAGVAKRQGGPAFTILVDATLTEIARERPSTLRELSAVKGIGPAKLENYGDDVLEIISRFA